MKMSVSLLGAEVLCVEFAPSPPVPAQGLTADGAPKRHETHTGGSTALGFAPSRSDRPVPVLEDS